MTYILHCKRSAIEHITNLRTFPYNIALDLPLLVPFGGGGVACISRAAVSKAAIPNA